jgi:tripartite-type tricarboxylate transporter receptor subunit TctC
MLALADAVAQGTADSQSYPNRTVRIIVPFPPGGPTDILMRVVGQRLSEVWHQPVVIETNPAPIPRSRPRASPRWRPTATPCSP